MVREDDLLQNGAGRDGSTLTGLGGMKGQALLNEKHLFRIDYLEV